MDHQLEKEIILETLSFYEWQNFEKILIGIDPKDLVLIESLAYEELEKLLSDLVQEGHLEKIHENKEDLYRRVIPRKKKFFKIF